MCDGRKKYVIASGADARRIRQSASELKKAAERALSVKLKEPEVTEEDGVAVSSRLTGIALGRLLYAGCDRGVTLETLNNIIRQRRAECFSTVDLLEADLITGKAAFYKCGASPSFIIRGGRAYRITSHTPPVGIMRELCAEKVEFTLRRGDAAVMVSDGVTGGNEETEWLCDLLCSTDTKDPEAICAAVLEEAEERYGAADDMTVLAVRFS